MAGAAAIDIQLAAIVLFVTLGWRLTKACTQRVLADGSVLSEGVRTSDPQARQVSGIIEQTAL
jgi:hypothetical protein